MDDYEFSRLIEQNCRMQAMVRRIKMQVHEEAYESADEQDPDGTSRHNDQNEWLSVQAEIHDV